MYFLYVNCKQLEVKHLPVLLTCSCKLCKPIHVPCHTEFHHNTSSILNTRRFLFLIFQHSFTTRKIYISIYNWLYFGICWVIPVAYYMQSTYIFEHIFQEILQLLQLSVTPNRDASYKKKIQVFTYGCNWIISNGFIRKICISMNRPVQNPCKLCNSVRDLFDVPFSCHNANMLLHKFNLPEWN
jgi:hypothetical protein